MAFILLALALLWVFNFVDRMPSAPGLRIYHTGRPDFEAALPDRFGLRQEELASLMNLYRAR